MAEPEIRYLGDLQRLQIGAGDKFVLTVPGRVSDEMRQRFSEMWERFAGESVPILVLEEGFRLGAISTGEG